MRMSSIHDLMAACHQAIVANLMVCLVLAGLLAGCTRRASASNEVSVHPAALVPFEDLFVPVDTLVLDYSVILGHVWFMEVDDSGSILVLPDFRSTLAHLFSSTGHHQATYSMDTCLPIDGKHWVWSARFADNDRVILSTRGGDMVVVDRAGNCLAARRNLLEYTLSFCPRGDSIFAFRGVRGMGPEATSIVGVLSMDLELEREIRLDLPRLFRLNITKTGGRGRNMECFVDGPYYKYNEDMDGRPVRRRSQVAMARPEFFVRGEEDIGPTGREGRRAAEGASTHVGLYALDEDIRMSRFSNIGIQYRPDGAAGRNVSGFSIASNTGRFRSVSTVSQMTLVTARHGYLYSLDNPVQLADGEVGNPTVIRYRFIVPSAADG